MSRPDPRTHDPGQRWFAIASLAWITTWGFLAPRLEVPNVLLASLGMLPAAFTHLALTFPSPTALVATYPRAVWVPYIVCAVPAATGVRSVARGPEGAMVLTTIALGLSVVSGAVLVARLVLSAHQAPPSPASQAARLALFGLAVTLLALALAWRGATPLAEAAVPAFPLALLAADVRLRRSVSTAGRFRVAEHAQGGVTLEQIAPGMAHAMRKPLAVVSDHLRSVSRTAPDLTLRHQLLESVELLEQVQRLVDGVLDLARGQVAWRARLLSLSKIVDQAVRDLRTRFPDAEIEVDPGSGFLMADEVSLRCLLIDLMENALEVPGAPSWVRVHAEHQGQWVQIEVEDRSGGIPEQLRDQLFDPFVTTKVGGTGLGLATVRELARAHGGTVEAQSTPEGTRFVVRLSARAP